jgi:hypothetical protein
MQAVAGKEEPLSAALLMNRSSDRWLLQQPLTSNSKPFPARRVTPVRLLSASAAADGFSPLRRQELQDEADLAHQVQQHRTQAAEAICFVSARMFCTKGPHVP